MPHLSPTRVSIYDFLYQDTHPIVPLLADTAHLALPQARQGLTLCLQAFCFGLIGAHQALDADSIHKRFFQRANVKTLRKYNAMNLHTMQQINLNVRGMATTLFNGSKKSAAISEDLAKRLATTPHQTEILLDLVIGLALRELSIIVDYAQLNNDEIAQWLSLQPQFLAAGRFAVTDTNDPTPITETPKATEEIEKTTTIAQNEQSSQLSQFTQLSQQPSSDAITPPIVDVEHWQTLLSITLPAQPTDGSPSRSAINADVSGDVNDDANGGLPSYAKAIGRTQTSTPNALPTASTTHSASLANTTPTTDDKQPLAVQFASMTGIHMPYRRWLLQLAQVADVYLSRQRLKINDEPDTPPSRPLVNFGFLEESRPLTASETPFELDKPAPLYKNPVILLIVAVIGGLLLLAVLKYQHQQRRPVHQPSAPTTLTTAPSQDVVILRVDDEDSTTEPPTAKKADNKADKQSNSTAKKDIAKDAEKDAN